MAASLWRHSWHDRKACLPAPFKSCHVRATVRNADVDKGNRKAADFTCFFFLRENRRSASKGFFLAWLNSGKKQTRLTTRLVVFSAFSAWRHINGFVADYDAIDKPRDRRLRSHAKKKPHDTQCRGFRLLMISEIMSAYHLHGKPRNSVENSNGTVHPGGNFPEKKEYFSRHNLFLIFTETTEIFLYHLFGLLVPRFMSRESKKLTGIL